MQPFVPPPSPRHAGQAAAIDAANHHPIGEEQLPVEGAAPLAPPAEAAPGGAGPGEAAPGQPAFEQPSLAGAIATSAASTGWSWLRERTSSAARSALTRVGGWCRSGIEAASNAASSARRMYTALPTPVRFAVETVGATGAMVAVGVPPLFAIEAAGGAQALAGAYMGDNGRLATGAAVMAGGMMSGAQAIADAAGTLVAGTTQLATGGVGMVAGAATTVAQTILANPVPSLLAAGAVRAVSGPATEALQIGRDLQNALNEIDIDAYQLSPPPFAAQPAQSAAQLRERQKVLWSQMTEQASLASALSASVAITGSSFEMDEVLDCYKAAAAGFQSWRGWRMEQARRSDPHLPADPKVPGWSNLTAEQRKALIPSRCAALLEQMLIERHQTGWMQRKMGLATFHAVREVTARILDRFSEKILPSLHKLHSPEGAAQVVNLLQVVVKAMADKVVEHQDVAEAIAAGERFVDEVSGALIQTDNVQEALEQILSGSLFNSGISSEERTELTQNYLIQNWFPDPLKPTHWIEKKIEALKPTRSGAWWQQLGKLLLSILIAPLALAWAVCRAFECIINPILRRVISSKLRQHRVLPTILNQVKAMMSPAISRVTPSGQAIQTNVAMTRAMTNMLRSVSWKLHELANNPPSTQSLAERKTKRRLSDGMRVHAKRLLSGLLRSLPIQQARTRQELQEALHGAAQPEALGPAAQFVRTYFGVSIDEQIEGHASDNASTVLEKVVDLLMEDETLLLNCVNSGLESAVSVFDPNVPEPTAQQVQDVDLEFEQALQESQKQLGSFVGALALANPSHEKRHELTLLSGFIAAPAARLKQIELSQPMQQALALAQQSREPAQAARARVEHGEVDLRWTNRHQEAAALLEELRALPADRALQAEAASVSTHANHDPLGRYPQQWRLQRLTQIFDTVGLHTEAQSAVGAINREKTITVGELTGFLANALQRLEHLMQLNSHLQALEVATSETQAQAQQTLRDWSRRTAGFWQRAQQAAGCAIAQQSDAWLDKYRDYRLNELSAELVTDLRSSLPEADPRSAQLEGLLSEARQALGELNVCAKAADISGSLEKHLRDVSRFRDEFKRAFRTTAALPESHAKLLRSIQHARADLDRLLDLREGLGVLADFLQQQKTELQQVEHLLQTLRQHYAMKNKSLCNKKKQKHELSERLTHCLLSSCPENQRARVYQYHLISCCLRELPLSGEDECQLASTAEWKELVAPRSGSALPADPRGLWTRLQEQHSELLQRNPQVQEKLSQLEAKLNEEIPARAARQTAADRTRLIGQLQEIIRERTGFWKTPLQKWAQSTLRIVENEPFDWQQAQSSLAGIGALHTAEAAAYRARRAQIAQIVLEKTQIVDRLPQTVRALTDEVRNLSENDTSAREGFFQKMARASSAFRQADEQIRALQDELPAPGRYLYERERLPAQWPGVGGLPSGQFFNDLASRLSPPDATPEQQRGQLHRVLSGVIGATIAAGASRKIPALLGILHNRALLASALDTGLTLVANHQLETSPQSRQRAPYQDAALRQISAHQPRRPVRR